MNQEKDTMASMHHHNSRAMLDLRPIVMRFTFPDFIHLSYEPGFCVEVGPSSNYCSNANGYCFLGGSLNNDNEWRLRLFPGGWVGPGEEIDHTKIGMCLKNTQKEKTFSQPLQ